MAKTYSDLFAEVRQSVKLMSARRAQGAPRDAQRAALHAGRRAREGRVPRRLHPRRRSHPARLPRDAGRAEAARQERRDRRVLRRRHALARSPPRRCSELGYTNVDQRQPRLRALEGPALPDRDAAAAHRRRSAIATRATSSCPRSARRGRRSCSRARVLLLGAGGLGSPAALYLAAAGVGTIGLVDADIVDASNLQRQILHATSRVGMPKVESAEKAHQRPEPRREGRQVPGAR